MPIIQLPDGQKVSFPDNATPEMKSAFKAKLAQKYGQPNAPQQQAAPTDQKSPTQKVTDFVATGLNKGVSGLLSIPNLVGESASNLASGVAGLAGYPETAQKLEEGKGAISFPDFNKLYKTFVDAGVPDAPAKSALGQIAQSMIAGLVTPVGVIPSVAASGASEAAGQAIQGITGKEGSGIETAARLAGGILGGAAASTGAIRNTPQEMVSDALKGVSKDELAQAAQRQALAQSQGIPLTAGEAIDSRALRQLEGGIANSRTGQPVYDAALKNRPDVIEQAIKQQARITGEGLTPVEVGRKAQAAAIQRLQNERQARTAAVKGDYAKLETEFLPKEANEEKAKLLLEINNKMGSLNEGTKEYNALRDFAKGLTASNKQPNQKSIAYYNNVRQSTRDKLKFSELNPSSLNAREAGIVQPYLDKFDELLTKYSPTYKEANQKYQQITKEKIEPLKQSPIADIAGKTTDTVTPKTTLDKALAVIADTEKTDVKTISQVARELNKTDKQAFPSVVGLYLENALDKAATRTLSTDSRQAIGGKFYKEVYGSPKKREIFKASMDAVDESRGVLKGTHAKAWDNLLKTLDQTTKVNTGGSITAPRTQTNQDAAQLPKTIRAFVEPKSTIKQFYQERNFKKLAKAFTDPNSVKIIEEMARTAPNTARARFLASQLIAYTNTQPIKQEEQK